MNKQSGKRSSKSAKAAPGKEAGDPGDPKETEISGEEYKKFQVSGPHKEADTSPHKEAHASGHRETSDSKPRKAAASDLRKGSAAAKAYEEASPEDIAADIERTRAHMDETLSQLGRRIRPRLPGRQVGIALGVLAAGLFAFLGYRAFASRKHRRSDRSPKWRDARVFEQVMLAKKLAMAARKGKPAIIVVEPRKI